jgi:hypothetical protein
VIEKAAQEDLMGEYHRAPLVVMSVVLPAKRHVGVSKIDKSVIGDCDAVRVPGQIVQNVFGTTEGAFRIYHPVFAKQRPQKSPEGGLLRQRKACAIESELLPAEGALQPSHKLATKDAAQDLHRKKETRWRSDPALAVWGQSAARHHAVNMWVPLQGLFPGMENAQEADLGSEVLGIGGDF